MVGMLRDGRTSDQQTCACDTSEREDDGEIAREMMEEIRERRTEKDEAERVVIMRKTKVEGAEIEEERRGEEEMERKTRAWVQQF
jgi:hypothetical protein